MPCYAGRYNSLHYGYDDEDAQDSESVDLYVPIDHMLSYHITFKFATFDPTSTANKLRAAF